MTLWPWLTIIGLGAWHGLNPAMGWLFAVALGLQRKSRGAVFQALLPIGIGHALAMLLVAVPALWLGSLIPLHWLQLGGGSLLAGFGAYKIFRARHPTWVGMRVGFWDLALWSGLMATAHGAGLMLVPVFFGVPGVFCGYPGNSSVALHTGALALTSLDAAAVHTLAHLVVAAFIAGLVYEFVGLQILRRSWFNIDFVWALGLVLAGVILLVNGTHSGGLALSPPG
jgi:hypothetical protein